MSFQRRRGIVGSWKMPQTPFDFFNLIQKLENPNSLVYFFRVDVHFSRILLPHLFFIVSPRFFNVFTDPHFFFSTIHSPIFTLRSPLVRSLHVSRFPTKMLMVVQRFRQHSLEFQKFQPFFCHCIAKSVLRCALQQG